MMPIEHAFWFCMLAIILGYWCGWYGHKEWEETDKWEAPWLKRDEDA